MATEKVIKVSSSEIPGTPDKVDGAYAQIAQLQARIQALENDNTKTIAPTKDSEIESRQRWFPWVSFVVLVNFILWFSMIYAIFEARYYYGHKEHYLANAWIIFVIPLALTMIILFSPFPAALKRTRLSFMSHQPSSRPVKVLNILNAAACFIFVVVYVYQSAIPKYNSPIWSTGIDFSVNLPIPAFALLIPTNDIRQGDIASVNVVQSNNGSYATGLLNYNNSRQVYPESAISVYPVRDRWTAVVFNSSLLNVSDFATIQDRLYISMDVNYLLNTTTIGDIDIESATSINFEMFDPRLSLETVLDCELAKYPLMPALAHNTFLVEVEYITDDYGLVISPDATLKCGKEYHDILAKREPKYASYRWQLESSIPTASNFTQACSASVDSTNSCRSTVSISFGSHLVHSFESIPGISHLDIWLNAGAITGTIQFFAWFLELLVS